MILIFSLLLLLTTGFNATGQVATNYDLNTNVEKEYKRIVDVGFLDRIKNRTIISNTKKLKDEKKLAPNGVWTKADPTTLALIKNYKETILEISKKYDVLPEAIAGAILGEYSLNFDLIDAAQFKLRDEYGVDKLILTDKVAKLLTGKQMTYGLGQVKFEWKEKTTEIINEIEPEVNFNFKEALFDQVGSFRIIAAILKYHQDNYLDEGLDISQSPGILVTLFNIGNSKLYAKRTVAESRDPKHNYMGLFVILYINDLKASLGLVE